MSAELQRLRERRTALDHKLAQARDRITAAQEERTRLAAERATVVADIAKATTRAAGGPKPKGGRK